MEHLRHAMIADLCFRERLDDGGTMALSPVLPSESIHQKSQRDTNPRTAGGAA